MYYVRGFCVAPNETGNVMISMGSILLPLKPYRGFTDSLSYFLS
jgi:hypothetical protein